MPVRLRTRRPEEARSTCSGVFVGRREESPVLGIQKTKGSAASGLGLGLGASWVVG